jgi:tRNA threonylcarbamoyladenosine biosynthesis protein TsaB
MNILGFDCAGPVISAGLLTETAFYQVEADGGQKHSELIMDMVSGLLKTAGLEPANLDAAACMRGPGSFTGVRIGFAAARGLALALGIPVVSVPTLDCMAWSHSAWPGIVAPFIDAKKNAFFTALYRAGTPLTDYLDAGPETVTRLVRENLGEGERLFITGPDAETALPFLKRDFSGRAVPDPASRRGRVRELLYLAKISVTNGENADINPLYLRKSDAELKAETAPV